MAAKRLELIRDLVPNPRYRRHDDNPTFPGGGLFRGVRRDGTTGHDHGDLTADQISRQRRQPVIVKFPPGPSCVSRNVAAHTRMVSVARIRLDFRKSARPFKGIICGDVSEFESYMPSHAVRYPSSRRGRRSMLRGRAAANIQPLLLGGYPYMVVVALPFRVTAEVPGEIEDPVAGEFVLSQAHSVPAKRKARRTSRSRLREGARRPRRL
jgi:hypothetical protein